MVSYSSRGASTHATVRAILKHSVVSLSPVLACAVLATAVAHEADNTPHPNPEGVVDEQFVLHRADVVPLPAPLKGVLGQLARRPHTYNPMRAFAEADKPSQLFQY